MKRIKPILKTLLYPPKWVLAVIPPLSFAALIFVFVSGCADGAPTYAIYFLSAYSLTVWAAAAPALIRRLRTAFCGSKPVRRLRSSAFGGKYLNDLAFRGSVGIYQGMTVNFLYVIFRVAAGIRYASVWFVSMAAYYLVLGGLRPYLIAAYRLRQGRESEYRAYRTTAWLLLLLNIPMGGMIWLMVRTNSGFTYPGYIIYLSALYTFYTMALSVVNLVRFRRLGSPILSAAKVLNFVAAMMSILGLQTAMISRFSVNGEAYRRMMNAVTGGVVYGAVILIAVYMLLHGSGKRKGERAAE